MKNLAFGLILAINAASMPVRAASDIQANPSTSLYLQDTRGIIVRSAQDLCWRTGHWTPADAVSGCDGELAPPITKVTAPPIISPTSSIPSPAPAAPKRCDFVSTLNNDETFAFNRTALSSAAKKRIDEELLTRLENCARVERISVTGHADRLGSQQYNMKLSAKRAHVVAEYLKAKSVSSEINVTGVGQTQPIKECGADLPRPQLIACLAPNRRVVIEVRGIAKSPPNF